MALYKDSSRALKEMDVIEKLVLVGQEQDEIFFNDYTNFIAGLYESIFNHMNIPVNCDEIRSFKKSVREDILAPIYDEDYVKSKFGIVLDELVKKYETDNICSDLIYEIRVKQEGSAIKVMESLKEQLKLAVIAKVFDSGAIENNPFRKAYKAVFDDAFYSSDLFSKALELYEKAEQRLKEKGF